MKATSMLGRLVPAISRRTPAFGCDHRQAIAVELRHWADELHEAYQSLPPHVREISPSAAALAELTVRMRLRIAELDPSTEETH